MTTLAPFTVDHFRAWCRLLTLDNGREWDPQNFQLDIAAEVFAGYREILALLPTGNAKTTLAAGIGLYHAQFVSAARVPIGAAASKQARITYDQAAGFVRRSPELRKRFRPQDGYLRIVCPNDGIIAVYSAQDDTGDGIIPSLAIIDEYGRQKSDALRATWRDKLTKRDGQLLTISAAGEDQNSPVEELREAAHRLPNISTGRTPRHTIARSDDRSFAMHQFALKPGDDPDDLVLVKQANPLEQITLEELRMRRDSPSTKRWAWERFTCARASKGEAAAIQPETWDALAEPDLEPDVDLDGFGWIDLGWKIDTSAVGVVLWESNDRRLVPAPRVIEPPVDEADVVAAILDFAEAFPRLAGFVYDPNAGAQQMVQLLEKGEHPLQVDRGAASITFIEHSQDNAPMALAAVRLDDAIRTGVLVHDGNGKLRAHVLNAVSKPLGGEKWKFDRPSDAKGEKRRKYPIDALTGLLMGHSIAVSELAYATGDSVMAFTDEELAAALAGAADSDTEIEA